MAFHKINITINNELEQVTVPSNMTLMQMLRESLALTGTKNGCTAGECGACTVLLNGKAINSCMMFAAQAEGADILTIEGVADGDRLDPLQEAFLDHGAVQCGFCTGGMILGAKALLARQPEPTEADVREALAGHFCRCTGYRKPVEAVLAAASGAQRPSRRKAAEVGR